VFVFKTDFEIGDSGCHDFQGIAADRPIINYNRFEPPIYQYDEHRLHTPAAINQSLAFFDHTTPLNFYCWAYIARPPPINLEYNLASTPSITEQLP